MSPLSRSGHKRLAASSADDQSGVNWTGLEFHSVWFYGGLAYLYIYYICSGLCRLFVVFVEFLCAPAVGILMG
jgi:hypothetical protein